MVLGLTNGYFRKKYNPMARFLALALIVFTFSACKKDIKYQHQIDDEKIVEYLTSNNLNAKKTESGLYYMVETDGTGGHPLPTSSVTVAYKGYFADNRVFDQSNTAGASFSLNQVIKGWTEGIPYFKKGGKGKLFIPSALGYGKNERQGIPANSVLIFDIHLIDFQ
jgi:FKBP-type peptidyl-prolyl cis-trans isomerase FkpA